jgi:hypothetical protein
MRKLTAAHLTALGAPSAGGAVEIEEWLRTLLGAGALRLDTGLVELRGPEPVVTTLGDLKKACDVAVETVKQGLRALEMDHWVLLVDGAHTRLLGPPRFRISVSKENLWGSVGGSIEVSASEGMGPLESIDYERLARPGSVAGRKRALSIEPMALAWKALARLTSGKEITVEAGACFLLAAGSSVRAESGRSGALAADLRVSSMGGRDARVVERAEILAPEGGRFTVEPGGLVELGRSNLMRLPSGETGILSIAPETGGSAPDPLDWGDDSHWLGLFRRGGRLVLFRRAIYAALRDVVARADAGAPAGETEWNLALGCHDCVLDGLIPFQAGLCGENESPEFLARFLRSMGEGDSLRARIREKFGFEVGLADARVSPAKFARSADRKLLRRIAGDPELNSETLSTGNKAPCWTQVGAYSRSGEIFPWEVTRELYFTHVSLHYSQASR